MKRFNPWMLAIILTINGLMMFSACTSNDDVEINYVITETDPSSTSEFNPEVLLHGVTYVGNDVDPDLKQALTWGSSAVTNEIYDDNIARDLYVVNKLTDIDESMLEDIYDQKALIAVVNPKKSDFEAYVNAHEWLNLDTENVRDTLLIYAFSSNNYYYAISEPGESEDPVSANLNRAQNCYMSLSYMLANWGLFGSGGADDHSSSKKMEDFANTVNFAETSPMYVSQQFRKLLWSDPDILDGIFYVTASYSIYMVHVYEGQSNAGDYYGVKMDASIASDQMWKNKGWNRHGGTYVRWCGWWNTDFFVESYLATDENGWGQDLTDRLMFPSGCYPSPATVSGSTTYTDTNSFSLELSESVGGEIGSEAGKKSVGANGQLACKQGWSWSHTESRTINDLDIANESRGTHARWHLHCQNVPKYNWDEDYGFEVTPAKTYRSTASVGCSWMWYDKTGKDNQDREPLWVITYMGGTYQMQSFVTTSADLQTTTASRAVAKSTRLPKMVNATAGELIISNNLKNKISIYDIEVIDAKTGKTVKIEKNTLLSGKKISLGHFKTQKRYQVRFKGAQPGKKAKTYTYTRHSDIQLENMKKTTLYALDDFTGK